MRTNEERIEAMHRRAEQLERESRLKRRARVIGSAVMAAGFAAVIMLAVRMPGVADVLNTEGSGGSMSGSIFAASGNLGYVVIGVIAFLLGSALTLFSMRLTDYRRDRGR